MAPAFTLGASQSFATAWRKYWNSSLSFGLLVNNHCDGCFHHIQHPTQKQSALRRTVVALPLLLGGVGVNSKPLNLCLKRLSQHRPSPFPASPVLSATAWRKLVNQGLILELWVSMYYDKYHRQPPPTTKSVSPSSDFCSSSQTVFSWSG